MPITTLPIPPNTIRPTTFAAESDAFLAALPLFVEETNATAAAVLSVNTAVTAIPAVVAIQVTAAQASATAAANSATLASLAAGATAWVSGTYAVNACAVSTIDFQTYRNKTAGVRTTDPSNDLANWVRISGSGAFIDTDPIAKGSADSTKLVRLEVDGITTGTTRVITVPDANITLAGTDKQQAFTKPQRPSLSAEVAPASGVVVWDLTNDSVFRINLNAPVTTFTLTGTLSVLAGYQYRVNVRFNGGTAMTWPAAFKWAANTAPALTGTSGKLDMFTFEVATTDGTNYYLCEIGRSQNVG